MKKVLSILLLTIVLFSLLTIKSARIESHFDGNDTYGFPLTFYTKFSGMCVDCPEPKSKTNYLNFGIDISFAVLIAIVARWLIILLAGKLRNQNRGNAD